MEKLIYLVWTPEGEDPLAWSERLRKEVAPSLLEQDPQGLTLNVNDIDVPAPLPTPPSELSLAAEVCIWIDCHDRRQRFEEILTKTGLPVAGYLVTESLYTEYGGNVHGKPRDWRDGERSPGLLVVTLLEKPERFSDEQWFAHWYGTQSPVSEQIQPRMRYVRNAVARALTPNAPPLRGIVDEAWPSPEHVTDPMLFYLANGSKERLETHMKQMIESVTGFLDLDRIRTTTMSEYLLKT